MKACNKNLFHGYIVYCAGNKIRAYNPVKDEYIVFDERIPDKKGCFFEFNGFLYYIGSGEYYKISFDEGSLSLGKVEGYIPLCYINCDAASGVGDDNEPQNYLTSKFRASFNTTANMTALAMPGGEIDVEKGVQIEYNGNLLSPSYYDINKNGTITFHIEVFKNQGHKNLVITASLKSSDTDRTKITNCDAAEIFGGSASGLSEGTRVFIGGNSDYKNTFFYSELRNAEYFPLENFEILGDSSEKITAFGKQSGGLVIFKERSVYISLYEYSSGEAIFTVTRISDGMGCRIKETLASVNNRLYWFNENYGVMALGSVGKNYENNVYVISRNINGRNSRKALLNKESYEGVTGFSYKNKYYLCTDDYCYVLDAGKSFDYFSSPEKAVWYLYSDIDGRYPVYGENTVYLVGKKERISVFDNILYDFYEDKPICARYVTKSFSLGNPGFFKTIKDISLFISAERNTGVEISCSDEDGRMKKLPSLRVDKFSFSDFKFSEFTFFDNNFAIFVKRKLSRKRVKFISVELKNEWPLSDMAISGLAVNFKTERGVKYSGI